jgi:hypothetical protein
LYTFFNGNSQKRVSGIFGDKKVDTLFADFIINRLFYFYFFFNADFMRQDGNINVAAFFAVIGAGTEQPNRSICIMALYRVDYNVFFVLTYPRISQPPIPSGSVIDTLPRKGQNSFLVDFSIR